MENSKESLLRKFNALRKNTLLETLAIEFTDVTETTVTASMPVTPKVHQPDGVLHGGASVALAETIGSVGAMYFMKEENITIRGIEIAANHVKSVRDGYVHATASILHKGRTTQLWQIRITNDDGALVSMVKLTTITLRT
ncbi:PaaI family thioesterase [Candidatus Ulvibacter alkanivorans]|uniref:PaaI family thioesterase n=1 Tax=Candidatus Ulvibacter alkanivorans TaxID=2267620 RepID=UPI000DF3AD75|nr:PaaI family thioesterase [Candidatus Ulvibacter alkanivorans]